MALVTSQTAQIDSREAQIAKSIDRYIAAATRENTRRSYQSAVNHFEVNWGGHLPATADQIAAYLANYAESLAASTLSQRLAALASWHKEQGFPDPTKAPLVKKVLKGIKELHPQTPKTAKPLQLEQLSRLDTWLKSRIQDADDQENFGQQLIYRRNRALVLLGFWRGFRSDELCRMSVENTKAIKNQGLTIFLPRSKGDRENLGTTHKSPALNELCPVQAYLDWIEVSGLSEGPVLRSVNRWGQLSENALHPNSIIALLKSLLDSAGIEGANEFSSHSLRRGFASWASANQWDLKALMEYVGWKDVKSAMRYIDSPDPFANVAFIASKNLDLFEGNNTQTILDLNLLVQRYHKGVRTMKKTRDTIERFCLKKHQARILTKDRKKYQLTVSHTTQEHLDKIIGDLIDEMHEIGRENECLLDIRFQDTKSGKNWD